MNKKSPLYVIGFIVVVSGLCGIAVSFVHFSMRDTLESNARLTRNRTIVVAFGLSAARTDAKGYDEALRRNVSMDTIPGTTRQWEVFTSRKPPHDVGFIFRGMGFWDMIYGIIVLSPDLSTIRSIDIIEQKETPGLGARIEEEAFSQQFMGYPLNWTNGSDDIITFGETTANGSGRINAITGATQTSMALQRILNSELAAFRKAYEKQRIIGTTQKRGN